MSTISAQQSPLQAPTHQQSQNQLPALPITQNQAQQSPVQTPVDQLELTPLPCSNPTKLNATQQSAPTTNIQAPPEDSVSEPAPEPEKKPWYAGIVSFFEGLIKGFMAIFNAIAPIFKFLAPLLGPLGGLFSGLTNGSGSQTSSPNPPVRPALNDFEERGTGSVRANAPLGIATGPVIDAPRASISSS